MKNNFLYIIVALLILFLTLSYFDYFNLSSYKETFKILLIFVLIIKLVKATLVKVKK